MKTVSRFRHPAGPFGWFLLLLVFLAATSARATAAPETTAAEPKTHTLFMGADLDLRVAGDFCRVQDVSGDSFVVNVNGSERLVHREERTDQS